MQQISVPLPMPDDILASVQRAAERECRTVAVQMRFFATEAARRASQLRTVEIKNSNLDLA